MNCWITEEEEILMATQTNKQKPPENGMFNLTLKDKYKYKDKLGVLGYFWFFARELKMAC